MMKINSDINVLGSLPDWNLISYFYKKEKYDNSEDVKLITSIKTEKSVKRFQKAISVTFLSFKSKKIELLFNAILNKEDIGKDLLIFLFWNASRNNDLLNYINTNVFFTAFYSGIITIKSDEVVACLNELKNIETDLKKWSESTIKTSASKYLTLLKKFGLLEGSKTKNILYSFLNKKMFVIFAYWLVEVSEKSNLINSPWLPYSFMEKNIFIDRLKEKQFTDYFNIYFTGDNLQIEPKLNYQEIYDAVTRN